MTRLGWSIIEESDGWAYRIHSRVYDSGWVEKLLQYDTGYKTQQAAHTAATNWMRSRNDWV